MGEFEGRSVVITGAASGIGRAAAVQFAAAGAGVLIADVDEVCGAALCAELTEGGARARFERVDVTELADCEQMVASALSHLGPLVAAFNNAGVVPGQGKLAGDVSLEDWRLALNVNLSGVFHSVRAELPALLENGGGAIVNTASAAGLVAVAGVAGYVAAKHGVLGLTKAICADYAIHGIRCNALAPGFIDTPLLSSLSDEASRKAMVREIPQGRFGRAEEAADAVVWLASSRSSYVNGATISVDGGFVIR